jgi:hypothetical protein
MLRVTTLKELKFNLKTKTSQLKIFNNCLVFLRFPSFQKVWPLKLRVKKSVSYLAIHKLMTQALTL